MTPSRIEIAVALACWSVAPHSALAQPIPLMPPPAAPGGNGPRFNTHSVVATDLTSPTLLIDGTPGGFLEAARTALQRGRTAEAQEALERAETRLLDRPAGLARDDVPDHTRTVLDIDVARRALAMRDRPGAIRAIDGALAASALASRPASPARGRASCVCTAGPRSDIRPASRPLAVGRCALCLGSRGDAPAPGRGPAVRAGALPVEGRSMDLGAKPFWR
jgi:hypothetical protein